MTDAELNPPEPVSMKKRDGGDEGPNLGVFAPERVPVTVDGDAMRVTPGSEPREAPLLPLIGETLDEVPDDADTMAPATLARLMVEPEHHPEDSREEMFPLEPADSEPPVQSGPDSDEVANAFFARGEDGDVTQQVAVAADAVDTDNVDTEENDDLYDGDEFEPRGDPSENSRFFAIVATMLLIAGAVVFIFYSNYVETELANAISENAELKTEYREVWREREAAVNPYWDDPLDSDGGTAADPTYDEVRDEAIEMRAKVAEQELQIARLSSLVEESKAQIAQLEQTRTQDSDSVGLLREKLVESKRNLAVASAELERSRQELSMADIEVAAAQKDAKDAGDRARVASMQSLVQTSGSIPANGTVSAVANVEEAPSATRETYAELDSEPQPLSAANGSFAKRTVAAQRQRLLDRLQ